LNTGIVPVLDTSIVSVTDSSNVPLTNGSTVKVLQSQPSSQVAPFSSSPAQPFENQDISAATAPDILTFSFSTSGNANGAVSFECSTEYISSNSNNIEGPNSPVDLTSQRQQPVFIPCTNPSVTQVSGGMTLQGGSGNGGSILHILQVRAVDALGNRDPSPATFVWTTEDLSTQEQGTTDPLQQLQNTSPEQFTPEQQQQQVFPQFGIPPSVVQSDAVPLPDPLTSLTIPQADGVAQLQQLQQPQVPDALSLPSQQVPQPSPEEIGGQFQQDLHNHGHPGVSANALLPPPLLQAQGIAPSFGVN
jgi:hypothetical protein